MRSFDLSGAVADNGSFVRGNPGTRSRPTPDHEPLNGVSGLLGQMHIVPNFDVVFLGLSHVRPSAARSYTANTRQRRWPEIARTGNSEVRAARPCVMSYCDYPHPPDNLHARGNPAVPLERDSGRGGHAVRGGALTPTRTARIADIC